METYKNSYSVKEDEVLWELHEIRHKLHNEQKDISLAERNRVALELFNSWKRVHSSNTQRGVQESK